jgi:hypothetical protein
LVREMYVWARNILGGFTKGFDRKFQIYSLQLNPIVGVIIESWASSKKRGSGVKGVKELLNLSCSMNYDSKRNPSQP